MRLLVRRLEISLQEEQVVEELEMRRHKYGKKIQENVPFT
jgi:hypothetical protein